MSHAIVAPEIINALVHALAQGCIPVDCPDARYQRPWSPQALAEELQRANLESVVCTQTSFCEGPRAGAKIRYRLNHRFQELANVEVVFLADYYHDNANQAPHYETSVAAAVIRAIWAECAGDQLTWLRGTRAYAHTARLLSARTLPQGDAPICREAAA